MHVAYRSTFRRDEDIELALEAATYGGAAALGLPAYGLKAGAPGGSRGRRRAYAGRGGRDPAEAAISCSRAARSWRATASSSNPSLGWPEDLVARREGVVRVEPPLGGFPQTEGRAVMVAPAEQPPSDTNPAEPADLQGNPKYGRSRTRTWDLFLISVLEGVAAVAISAPRILRPRAKCATGASGPWLGRSRGLRVSLVCPCLVGVAVLAHGPWPPYPAHQRSGRCPSRDESVRTGRSPSRSDRLDGCRSRSYPRSARCSSTSRAELSPTSCSWCWPASTASEASRAQPAAAEAAALNS